MKKYLLFLSAIALLVALVLPSGKASAALTPWDPGRIIDDGIFTNKDAMSVQDIQNFLNAKVPTCDTNHAAGPSAQGAAPPWTCLKNYYENVSTGVNNLNGAGIPSGGISAAQIIWNYAQQYNINPQVLIVTLQKENGLITDTWPYPWQYRTAMGFACPDNGSCDPAYYGFSKQVSQAARHFRNFYDENPNWTVPYKVGTRFIQYSPTSSCGGTNVNIQTHGTAALYSYTPYQPNTASLNAGYGTGDSCSSYGNRNFFNYFSDWFGSTVLPSYASQYVSQSAYPALLPGQSATVSITYRNTGFQPWYDNATASSAGKLPIHLATSHGLNRRSNFGSAWGGDQNRSAGLFDTVYKADGTPYVTNPHVVGYGESVKFTFPVTALGTMAPGVYREFFQPIVEGTVDGAMNDPWTFMDVTVQPATYTSAYVDQSSYPTLLAGDQTTAWFKYKNTGNQSWYDNASAGAAGRLPIHMATSHGLNRRSAFGSVWGGDQNRSAGLFTAVYEADGITLAGDQHVVQPGQIAKFSFPMTAPSNMAPGTYREFFQPIVEGGTVMNDPWTFLDVKVQAASYTSAYVDQSPYPTITRGQQATAWFKYKNTGNQSWYDNASAGTAGKQPLHLATTHPMNRSSIFGTPWGGDRNRSAGLFSAVYEANGTTMAADQHVVQPGQIVKIDFPMAAPANANTGVYREFFQPIIEGLTVMNDPWTFLDVTVQ
jgi:hypothetical protein